MVLCKKRDTYNVGAVKYVLLENHVVAMPNAGLHSFSIVKEYAETGKIMNTIADGIKSEEATMLIWADVIAGIQK